MKYTVDSDVLYKNLQELLAQTGLNGVNKRSVQRLLALSAIQPGEPALLTSDAPFKDEVTGLLLPPPPAKCSYIGHREVIGERLPPSVFVQTFWPKYARKEQPMMYAPHLGSLDSSLLEALRHQARTSGTGVDGFLLSVGVLSRSHIENPLPLFERQASVFRRLTIAARASATLEALSARDSV